MNHTSTFSLMKLQNVVNPFVKVGKNPRWEEVGNFSSKNFKELQNSINRKSASSHFDMQLSQ